MTASSEAAARLPRLHLITDDPVLSAPGFPERAAALVSAGGDRVALHLRGPRATGRAIYEAAAELRVVARAVGATLIVNDRVDVVAAAGADGVQLGARSIPPAEARRLLGERAVIGASVHSVAAARAVAGAVDFLVAGTIYPTASHPGRRAAGAAWLTDLTGLGVPVIGIGGVTPTRVAEVLDAGAHGVAVLGAVWHAPEPVRALQEFLSMLEG